MAIYEDEKSSNHVINNGTISDDEVVASDVPSGTCFIRKDDRARSICSSILVKRKKTCRRLIRIRDLKLYVA